MALIDLSHVVEDGMTTYPGLPCPVVAEFLSREASRARYAPGTSFRFDRIEMLANTGTYVDAPLHRFADGVDVAGLPLEQLADLPGVVVQAEGARAVDVGAFADVDVADRAVLVHTGWDRHWRTARYGVGHPFLTAAAAEELVRRGARFVGIDSLNIDDADDGRRPVHTALLGAGIPIGEHLTALARLPDGPFRFHAAPVAVAGMGSFPVRAYAVTRD